MTDDVPMFLRFKPMEVTAPDGVLRVYEWRTMEKAPIPTRTFDIRLVPDDQSRGGHAHRGCWQYMRMSKGSAVVLLQRPGREVTELLSDSDGAVLIIPPLRWVTITEFSPDAVLTVDASHAYDESDYINDADEFDRLCQEADRDPLH